jgi:hypothetical protein
VPNRRALLVFRIYIPPLPIILVGFKRKDGTASDLKQDAVRSAILHTALNPIAVSHHAAFCWMTAAVGSNAYFRHRRENRLAETDVKYRLPPLKHLVLDSF